MKKKRLIPLILIKNGFVVQSRNFQKFQKIGIPLTSVKRYSEFGADEVIILDISRENSYDLNRDDLNFNNASSFLNLVKDISKICFMPMTIGGKIKSLHDIESYLLSGADKVSINTAAISNPDFLELAVKEFGSQCIVNSVDVKLCNNEYSVFVDNGSKKSTYLLNEWLEISKQCGSGEIFINSIDRDGTGIGFDLNLINITLSAVNVPVICCGGAGKFEDFIEVASKTDVDGIVAANFFNHIDQSIYLTKKHLFEKKLNFREPKLIKL